MLHEAEVPVTSPEPVRQVQDFRSGNEAAALAARDIGFHVMGYFPITPPTEVAENLYLNGFVSQGYLNSSENDYLVSRSVDGTAAFTEAGRSRVSDRYSPAATINTRLNNTLTQRVSR